jgi:hypothetical protein
MATDFNRDLDYDALVFALINKTLEGKLAWQETADASTFIAAVKGERTFEISEDDRGAHLSVKDNRGKDLFYYSSRDCRELFALARRVALRLDEKLDSTVELLNQL